MKNYTSSVSIQTTIARIEFALVKYGAQNIVKDYVDGKLSAICFTIETPGQKRLAIRMPANVEGVYKVLERQVRRPKAETFKRLKEQAERTAWKIIQEWIEIQMSLIEMQQAEFLEVFLPYVWDGKQTFFAMLKGNGFKALKEQN